MSGGGGEWKNRKVGKYGNEWEEWKGEVSRLKLVKRERGRKRGRRKNR